jgi:hypothetical protein
VAYKVTIAQNGVPESAAFCLPAFWESSRNCLDAATRIGGGVNVTIVTIILVRYAA